jgi:integrase
MATVKFYLKDPNSKEETEIFLLFNFGFAEITETGAKKYKPLKYYTSDKIKPKFWGNGKAKETAKFPGYKTLNERLDDISEAVKDVFRDIQNKDIIPTHELLKAELDKVVRGYKEPQQKKQSFFEYIQHYIDTCDKKRRTKLNYGTTQNVLKKYNETLKKKLTFELIDLDFYDGFIEFLKKKNNTKNTIGSHIKNIKVFMNNAVDRNIIDKWDERIRKRFVTIEEDADSIYLSQSELDKLYAKNLVKNPRLDKVRDLFLIGCYTGLRFSDLAQLKPENFTNNNTLLKLTTVKTEDAIVIPVGYVVTEILKKYKYNLPRIISNQKFNKYLKELGELVKINEPVQTTITKGGLRVQTTSPKFKLMTVHTARRSFSTNAYLADIPSISIMKITGHRTERAFLRYIRISPEDNAKKLMQHPFFSNLKAV